MSEDGRPICGVRRSVLECSPRTIYVAKVAVNTEARDSSLGEPFPVNLLVASSSKISRANRRHARSWIMDGHERATVLTPDRT
ncbi:hypothetical protein L226DRAFT_202254 [Lentinus tigrinus ALCF2SS1-7]|uniref:uncharacterized protein n=1 Tax=Lentinus tigrinus ALCF2SS1-7 TaxID=1328758 RepID=UPI001165D70F|nr:hypothetical protein L226DRAFT_202254 [Lentinus tigrinus ALCF2SS1-7]